MRAGKIWEVSPRSRGQIVRQVCERLEEEYGLPRHGNPEDPVDDLIYILLSVRTLPYQVDQAFRKLQQEYDAWEELLVADHDRIADLIRPAGFADRRTNYITSALAQIQEDYGLNDACDLWTKPDAELLEYLKSLQGVSGKVARCVMMYALGRNVLPVDVHVHRVASRLGWTGASLPAASHDELEALLPAHRYYAFHVTCVAHGRSRCTASNPRCDGCPILRYCQYGGGEIAP